MRLRIAMVLALGTALAALPALASGHAARAAGPTDPLSFSEAYYDIGLDGAAAVAVAPGGNHVYVAGYSDDGVSVFRVDAATGRLVFVEMEQQDRGGVDGLLGPKSIALSPDGGHLYVASNLSDAIAVFGRAIVAGTLTYVGMVHDGVGGVSGLGGVESVAVSPGGAHVYAASSIDDAVAVFSRDPDTGVLTFVEAKFDGVDGVDGLWSAQSVSVSQDGKHVYVASRNDDAVAIFTRDGTTGSLTYVGSITSATVADLECANSLVVGPGGSHVYVTSQCPGAVVAFSRDAATGALTFVEAERDGVGGVDGLDGACSVAISPGGEHVYVASLNDDTLALFSRNGTTGLLTYLGKATDGLFVVDGLNGANSVAISPDGTSLYVAGREDDAVAIFHRNSTTGALTYLGMVKDGVGGVDGLNGARAVVVSPDGSQVYVASQLDDALAVFARDPDSGPLTFAKVHKDGQGGVDGLSTADGLAVSTDGGHVYVAGYGDDAVAVFIRNVVYLPLVLRSG